MNKNAPSWALRPVTTEDLGYAIEAHRQGRMQIKWPDIKALRRWAKQQGWPIPFFGFEEAFITKMLATKDDFELAVATGGLEIQVPIQNYTISGEKMRELDALYEARSSTGHPNSWGILVEELRDIRRAVEMGVAVKIEGEQPLHSWQDFYAWAHGRYHMLEDGYDKWIGNDA